MSTTITVTSAAELNQALSQATGGETILLAAGDYGTLNLDGKSGFNINYASNVTIKSADANTPATISEMTLDGASNITFENIVFDYTFNGESTSYKPFEIHNSANITIKDSVFDGDLAQGVSSIDDGYGTGKALAVRDSSGIVISNNEFYDWWKGLSVGASTNVTISGNDVHSVRSDGMSFGGVQNVLIENNYLHDFRASPNSGDHRDMIQFSKGLGPSDNVIIRDNVFDMGTGTHAQTIFMGNGKTDPDDPAMFYTNILIEDNMIYNAHTHGITVTGAKDLTISHNTILAVDRAVTGGITIPKINVTSTSQNVTIDGNVVSGVAGHSGQSDWTVIDNVYVQNTDPSAANYYDNMFIYYATAALDGYNQYGIIPGSAVDTMNAGSDLAMQFPLSYDAWVGSTGVNAPPAPTQPDTGTTQPDTGTTQPDTGTTQPDTGTTQPDTGTTQPDTGTTQPDNGDTGGGQSQLSVDDYILDIAGLPGNDAAELQGDASVVNTASGPAIHFDGHGDAVKIGRLQQFESSDELAFTVEFTRDEADGSEQRLVWNKGRVGLALDDDGLVAYVQNNDAKFSKGFRVDNIGLNDTDTHLITLMVDETTDRLQVLVDGVVVLDETSVDFDFVDAHGGRQWGWNLGSTRNYYIDGEISHFAVDDDVAFIDSPVTPDDWLGA
ncbi:right-handed parallel beta-helix repeat-containing protein [Sulfitobacter sp. M23508]|uniref:right-handed parallel beta-helix repeat-containing protein n=1 Tax=Sulfitobacter sp. M23508 TaxID=3368577 RepID=UPI0037454CB4